MKQNQNVIAAIDHKHANSCPFLTFLSVAEKTGRFHEVILAVEDMIVLVTIAFLEWRPLWRGGHQRRFDCM